MTLKQDQWISWAGWVLAGFRVVGDVNVTQSTGWLLVVVLVVVVVELVWVAI